MYKRIALLILSGLLITACDKKADAPAEAAAPAEVTAPAQTAPAEEAAPVTEAAPLETSGEIGIAECDDYIEKYRACMNKMPAEGRAAYQQGLDQMVESWKSIPAEARSSLAEGCKMSTESSRSAMQAMGCDW